MADDVKSDDSQTRAHAETEDGPVVQQRVAVIVELKMALRYRRRTAKRLADEWGVTEQYVHNLSCRANKVVRQSAVDPDAVAAELLPDLLLTFRATGRSVRKHDGDEHAQAKMAASYASIGTLLADVAGLKAAKKTELTGADGGPLQVTGPTILIPPESND